MSKEIVYEGSRTFGSKRLAEIWANEVGNDRMAWYVDYFLEEPAQFQVRLLAEDDATGTVIRATNENKEQRDPNDPENSQWGSEDVGRWFIHELPNGNAVEHRWVLLFTSPQGEVWGIHIERNLIFCFGPDSLSLPAENLWDIYVEHGLAGPMMASNNRNSKLLAFIDQPDVFGFIEREDVLQHYMVALAGAVDS